MLREQLGGSGRRRRRQGAGRRLCDPSVGVAEDEDELRPLCTSPGCMKTKRGLRLGNFVGSAVLWPWLLSGGQGLRLFGAPSDSGRGADDLSSNDSSAPLDHWQKHTRTPLLSRRAGGPGPSQSDSETVLIDEPPFVQVQMRNIIAEHSPSHFLEAAGIRAVAEHSTTSTVSILNIVEESRDYNKKDQEEGRAFASVEEAVFADRVARKKTKTPQASRLEEVDPPAREKALLPQKKTRPGVQDRGVLLNIGGGRVTDASPPPAGKKGSEAPKQIPEQEDDAVDRSGSNEGERQDPSPSRDGPNNATASSNVEGKKAESGCSAGFIAGMVVVGLLPLVGLAMMVWCLCRQSKRGSGVVAGGPNKGAAAGADQPEQAVATGDGHQGGDSAKSGTTGGKIKSSPAATSGAKNKKQEPHAPGTAGAEKAESKTVATVQGPSESPSTSLLASVLDALFGVDDRERDDILADDHSDEANGSANASSLKLGPTDGGSRASHPKKEAEHPQRQGSVAGRESADGSRGKGSVASGESLGLGTGSRDSQGNERLDFLRSRGTRGKPTATTDRRKSATIHVDQGRAVHSTVVPGLPSGAVGLPSSAAADLSSESEASRGGGGNTKNEHEGENK